MTHKSIQIKHLDISLRIQLETIDIYYSQAMLELNDAQLIEKLNYNIVIYKHSDL